MELITTREALPADLETLYAFEQGIVTAERPYDPTMKEGEVHYYDLAELVSSPDAYVAVAVSGEEIVGSGYARLLPRRRTRCILLLHTWVLCM